MISPQADETINWMKISWIEASRLIFIQKVEYNMMIYVDIQLTLPTGFFQEPLEISNNKKRVILIKKKWKELET